MGDAMTSISRRGFLLAAAASLGGCAAYEPAPSYPLYGRPAYYPYPPPYAYGYGYYGDDYWRRRRRWNDDDRRHHRHRDDDDDDHDRGRDHGRDHGRARDDDRKPDRRKPPRREARGPTDEELLMRLNGSRNRDEVLRRLGRPDLIAR